MGLNQWYLHFSRLEGADTAHIRKSIQSLRKACKDNKINITLGFGPKLLKDLSITHPTPFKPYETFKSIDGSGREAKGTQEELLIWINHDHKDKIWKAQYDFRIDVEKHMKLARETPTFI